MQILDIHLAQENNTLKFKVTTTLIKDEEEFRLVPVTPYTELHEKYADQSIQTLMLNKFGYEDLNQVMKTLARMSGSVTPYANENVGIVYYHMPVDPILALDFIAALNDFVVASRSLKVTFNDEVICDDNKHGEKEVLMAEHVVKALMNMQSIPNYAEVISDLKKIMQWQEKNPSYSLSECLEIQLRFNILSGFSEHLSDNNQFEKWKLFKSMWEQGDKQLNHFIASLGRELKMQLYYEYLQKNEEETWESPRWQFLRDVQFHLRKDGKVSVKLTDGDVASNNQLIAFKNLAEIAYLDFSEDTHCPNELVFSEQSSEKLKEENLHINKKYLDELLKTNQTNSPTVFAKQSTDALSDLLDRITSVKGKDTLRICEVVFDDRWEPARFSM